MRPSATALVENLAQPRPWLHSDSSFQVYESALRRHRFREIPRISSGVNWLAIPNRLAHPMDIETRVGLSPHQYAAPFGIKSTCQVLMRYEALLGGADHHR